MAVDGGRLSRRAQLVDVALAVVLFAVDLLLWVLQPRELWPQSWAVAIGWQAVAYVALALRRRTMPLAIGLISVQVTLAQVVPGVAPGAVPLIILTYTVAAH